MAAFGLDTWQVEVSLTAITVWYDPGGSAYPIMLMRVVRTRIPDYGRWVVTLVLPVLAAAAPLRRGTRHRDSPVTWPRRVVASVASER